MKDKDRIQLINLLLEEMDGGVDSCPRDSLSLGQVLGRHYRDEVCSQGAGNRMADLIEQYEHCQGPFRRNDNGEVLPGRWTEE